MATTRLSQSGGSEEDPKDAVAKVGFAAHNLGKG